MSRYMPERALDSNGNTVVADLYIYESGGTTPVTAYSDAAMTTAHTRPIPSTAAGGWPAIYLPDGVYRVDMQVSGSSLDGYPADNVPVIAPEAPKPPTRTLLTSGTAATYDLPEGCAAIFVRVQGAGGGSGAATGGGTGTVAMSGGAGGGGYVDRLIEDPAASYTYTIGAAGAGGSGSGVAGSDGGTTSFSDGGAISLSASGGSGSPAATASSNSGSTSGAAGGTATGGDRNIQGGRGGLATRITGVPSSYSTGGASEMGRGGIASAGVGETPPGYGGGASGSSVWGTTNTNQGADGAPAIIEIWEYY